MKTYNVQLIFENDEDKQSLIKSLSLKRDAFNIISKIRFGMKSCNGLMPLHQRCYKMVREQLPMLPSQFVIKAEQDVVAKYKSLRSNCHKITEPVETNRLNIQLDTRIYTWIGQDAIKLTTCNGRITAKLLKYNKVNELFSKYKLKDPSLFVRDDRVFLSIVFDDTTTFQDNKKCIGVDLGLKRLASTSEGIIIKGNEFNRTKRKIRWNKRKLQSHKSHSTRVKQTKLRRREHHFSKNYIHNVVNHLLTTKANTIVIEDLTKIKSKFKGRRFNNRNSQMPYFLLRNILTYKAASLGKQVVIVNPHWTSQLDHRGLDNGVRKGCRYYGLDKVVLDADLNAANNITFRYDKEHSISCSALDGQVAVNQPIVRGSSLASTDPLGSCVN
jgi:IS605 OrfB family transposase